jgi:hypothetical protein
MQEQAECQRCLLKSEQDERVVPPVVWCCWFWSCSLFYFGPKILLGNHPLLVGLSLVVVVLELEARTSMPRMMHEVVRAATVL